MICRAYLPVGMCACPSPRNCSRLGFQEAHGHGQVTLSTRSANDMMGGQNWEKVGNFPITNAALIAILDASPAENRKLIQRNPIGRMIHALVRQRSGDTPHRALPLPCPLLRVSLLRRLILSHNPPRCGLGEPRCSGLRCALPHGMRPPSRDVDAKPAMITFTSHHRCTGHTFPLSTYNIGNQHPYTIVRLRSVSHSVLNDARAGFSRRLPSRIRYP